MIDEDIVAAIDRVLLEGITFPLKSRHFVQGQEASKLDPNLFEQLFQELRDIAFKEDLVEKFKGLLSLEVNFNTVKEKIDDSADAFSSDQLEQVGVVVSFLNNIVRILRNSTIWKKKKEHDSVKKNIGQNNEALKESAHTPNKWTQHQSIVKCE